MSRRNNKSKIFKDENGTQYLNRIEYPAIPIRDDDVFIRGVFGETFMNIAHRFYQNKDLGGHKDTDFILSKKIYSMPEKIPKFNDLSTSKHFFLLVLAVIILKFFRYLDKKLEIKKRFFSTPPSSIDGAKIIGLYDLIFYKFELKNLR